MNYHKQMLEICENLAQEKKVPTLLLHTCCAPCSSTVISILANYFLVTVYYYNPNIEPITEYLKRKEEQKRFIKEFPTKYPVKIIDCDYDGESFKKMSKGLENVKEGGIRCYNCYKLRLLKTALKAKEDGYDYFASSLSVSPYKNSAWLNEIGMELENLYHVKYLVNDFKKEQGYLKSIEYSKEFNLYRQNYCGCIYSKKARVDNSD